MSLAKIDVKIQEVDKIPANCSKSLSGGAFPVKIAIKERKKEKLEVNKTERTEIEFSQ